MSGAEGYSVLFEPVQIGPVTARNRFYQVPHCNGLGHLRPQAEAAMRAMKAEGGWAVVSTQEAEIHPTSDLSPYSENRIWDDQDIPALRLITNSIHEKGSLAAIQLAHNGHHAQNHLTRAPLLAPSELVLQTPYPKQARAMDKADIREFRQWHRAAARRSREAGFDIVYVYAGHHMTLPHHFLLPQFNDRTDEYGGSLENRVRLTRELLEETKEEVGDNCAIALRFAVDEMLGSDGMQAQEEGRAVVEMLAELPDLWDVNVADWSNDSATTRFEPRDGFQTSYIEFVKQVTSKPVVGVGRLTSPDLMASLVRKGILDFIGAARPSIADPFLPNKIKEGRIEEIRECIGCNICVSSDSLGVPIRCTQNPTMGEEWRRKWHPEIIERRVKEEAALVVGSGPAGLECAMQLARRGYEVTLAEAKQELGGRVLQEAGLTGLSAWKRVTDHRIYDLQQRGNVQLFTDSPLSASEVVELGIPNVFVSTGAKWRRDGRGKSAFHGVSIGLGSRVFTPDDIMTGVVPEDGPVVVYDDDQAYLGGVLADHLAQAGQEVFFVTPASLVSPFTELTLEQTKVQRSLLEKGVHLNLSQTLANVAPGQVTLQCVYTGRENSIECSSVVLVTQRMRETTLYDELCSTNAGLLNTLELIGDAANPGLIADAVYSGHMAARNFERNADDIDREFFRRELVSLEPV
ncbi:FAD-dependent oxidoreductase [Ruegeria conchae]|uniref:oxidoreductase n=1 Tax=Ruegeria conchae TaxID=981384 RepID=UPI00147C67C5|nr:FAD-dependent oxidoreductase [Ruegeria conchae]UWR03745.1 FAD-dependent oxidoreductase [Ruegeria conchae]